jgi:hypothetical protein
MYFRRRTRAEDDPATGGLRIGIAERSLTVATRSRGLASRDREGVGLPVWRLVALSQTNA